MKQFRLWLRDNNRRSRQFLIQHPVWYWKFSTELIEIKRIFGQLGSYVSGKTLDLGAGEQMYKSWVQSTQAEYLAFDINAQRSQVDIVGDVQAIPLKAASIDTVVCMQVLEHVPAPWLAFNEIARVLKPDNYAIVSVPHLGYLHNEPHDYYRFTHHGLRFLAAKAGLDTIKLYRLGGLLSFLGYIRSTLIQPLLTVPLLGRWILELNYWVSKLEMSLDSWTQLKQVMPTNYLLVLHKPSQPE